MPDFHGLLVERVHQFLVIEPEGVFRLGRQRVADGVELPAGWRALGQGLVHFIHPAGLPGRHHRVGQHAGMPRRLVDHVGGFGDLRVVEEFPGVIIEGRAAQHGYRGIAVEVDLAHVVLELHQVHADVVRVQAVLPYVGAFFQEAEEALLRVVVAHEVGLHVEDELVLEGLGAFGGQGGVGSLGL